MLIPHEHGYHLKRSDRTMELQLAAKGKQITNKKYGYETLKL